MTRYSYAAVALGLISIAIPLRAADRPHVGTDRPNQMVWTNDDLDKLHALGLISIVGRNDDEKPASGPAPAQYVRTQDPEWYAQEAARLRLELEYRQKQLRDYQQALDDARSLTGSTAAIDLVGEDFAVTPEAGIEILQQRVTEEQTKLDDLEDLARRNDIEPGTLRAH